MMYEILLQWFLKDTSKHKLGDSRKNSVYNRRRNGQQNYRILKCYENEWLLIMHALMRESNNGQL